MRSGAIDDPSVPRQLAARAAAFVGTCEGMCPAFEIEEREAQFNVDRWELVRLAPLPSRNVVVRLLATSTSRLCAQEG